MDITNNVMKLEGARNWNIWKFQMTVLMRGQGWLDIVEGRTVKPEDATERTIWESKDAKAQTLLVTRMSEDVMIHLVTCTTSSEMWKKLLSVYEQKSETSIHIIQQRFFQYKYEKGVEMSVFLSKIQEIQNQLKQLGEEISDKFAITKVLMSLPDEYKHFVSAWESAPEDKQTFDNLVTRLLIEEERLKEKTEEKDSTPSSSAFVARRNIKCFKCGKSGHYQTECRSNKDSEKKVNDNKCFYCGKIGHYKAQCRFRMSKDNKKISNAFIVSDSVHKQYVESQWLVDSGASEHMCRNRSLFSSFQSVSQKSVIVGNGATISVLGCGQMAVQVNNGSDWINTTIDNVLYVPELKTNLFSVNRAADRGYVIMTDDSTCKFLKNGVVCAIGKRLENSYYLDFRYKCDVASVARVATNDLNEWHEKLAHQNFDYVKKVLKQNNIEIKQSSVPQCESCLKGKIHRLPFKKSDSVTTRTCEVIHGDTCGPMEVESIGGSRYYVVLKDDYSNFRTVYFVKAKHEIKHCLEDFLNKAENTTGNKVKTFRTDNGLEFINKEVMEMCSKRGIIHETTVTYTPEQNGKAERENRTLVEAARTMLHAKNLPKKLWAEAVNTAAFVLNRTGKGKDGKSPYEIWTNKKYDIHQLKAFGSPVFVHIPKERRRKWDSKGEKGLMIGYGEHVKGYRVYFPERNCIDTKRDVVFLNQDVCKENESTVMLGLNDLLIQDEHQETKKVSEITEDKETQSNSDTLTTLEDVSTGESESYSEYEPCDDELSEVEETTVQNERRKRVRKQTSFYQCHNVVSKMSEPTTYKEAMGRKDASKWKEAIKKELQTLNDNNTWTFCEAPVSENIISTKWVFKLKGNSKDQYKARLVARGFEQASDFDLGEIYAPVAKLSTFRVFVAIATHLNLPIYQMDVTGAFLYGDIDREVYIKLPEGAYSGEKNIVKLNKALYGLKNSPKCWNNKFNSVISREGFIKSNNDSCLFKKCNGIDKMYVLLYVDDILFFGTNKRHIEEFKNVLNNEFEMKDMGLISNFLGINVKQNLETGTTELDQISYLESVLRKFNMENCKDMSTPMEINFNTKILTNETVHKDKNIEKLCRQIIGSLMYAASGTRPDLCYPISLLSRYQSIASNELLSALKRVLRYTKHTLNYKLVFKCKDINLQGYCDADWAGDVLDRKSTSGYMFKLSDCLILWCSKKQASVSLSSTESEYVSLSMAASDVSWLINLLTDFSYENVCPVNIFCDNQSAIINANSDTIKRLKHIDIRYHFVKDLVKDNKICIKYIKTNEQPADMLTKILSKELIVKHLSKCGVTLSIN